jgi:hypothetical protein
MNDSDDKRVGGKPYATQIEPKKAKTDVAATRSMPILQRQWRSSALARSACGMHALTRLVMDEHDDDLESEVHVAAEKESESFPVTGDELDDVATDQPADGDEDPPFDEDEAEI